eukprot:1157435-Pelagomonas_calceolata.AAC.1
MQKHSMKDAGFHGCKQQDAVVAFAETTAALPRQEQSERHLQILMASYLKYGVVKGSGSFQANTVPPFPI